MKVKLIIISIILLIVMAFASGCSQFMENIGMLDPADEEQLSPEKSGPPDGLVKVLIGFKEKPGAAQQAMVKGVGGKIKYTYNIVDAIAASIPEKAIEALQKNPNVRYIEPDGQVYALDEELDNTWGVKHIGAGLVHDSNKGAGVRVAIIDTGIYSDHGDLTVAGGKSFVSYTVDFDDDDGHGTHVAGTVAALDDGFGVIGVAPEASLYALKALDYNGNGYVSDVAAAIQWAIDPNGDEIADDRLDIINMSLGGGANLTLEEACQSAYDKGLLLVASAGNSGNPPGRGDNVGYPAAYGSVIAVAATDQNDKRAKWSSTGPDVELSAPGVAINSTLLGGGYGEKSGTSMASPHVAGVAALVWAATPGLSNEAVRIQLMDTADYLGDSSLYGYGLVDAAEAAGVDTPLPNEPPAVSITSPADGSTFDSEATILFKGTANDTEDGDLTTGLVWTSNLDGQIDTGGSFSTTLSDGDHTITAEVIDLDGATGSDSISITVGTHSTNIMHVFSIDMSFDEPTTAGPNTFYTAVATITIFDNSEPTSQPVEGATVSGHWSGATNDSDSGITDGIGQVSLQSDKVKNPESVTTFTFTVDDVTKEGWTYDSPLEKPSGSITYYMVI